MMVGAWPAPMAVLILVLYASFWNVVPVILELGLALLKRLTVAVRTCSPGAPDRYQYVAAAEPPPPLLVPGPELPQAARAAAAPAPAERLRKLRRDRDVRSTVDLRARTAAHRGGSSLGGSVTVGVRGALSPARRPRKLRRIFQPT